MCEIPEKIANEEIVMRTIFSPANFNKKGKLRSNFMRPKVSKPDEDNQEIASNKLSVTRYNYVDIDFCRQHAKRHSSLPNRNYWGFAKFVVEGLRNLGSDVVSKPTIDNFAHANIVYPFQIPVLRSGETLDPELEFMFHKYANDAIVLQDPSPNSDVWNGVEP